MKKFSLVMLLSCTFSTVVHTMDRSDEEFLFDVNTRATTLQQEQSVTFWVDHLSPHQKQVLFDKYPPLKDRSVQQGFQGQYAGLADGTMNFDDISALMSTVYPSEDMMSSQTQPASAKDDLNRLPVAAPVDKAKWYSKSRVAQGAVASAPYVAGALALVFPQRPTAAVSSVFPQDYYASRAVTAVAGGYVTYNLFKKSELPTPLDQVTFAVGSGVTFVVQELFPSKPVRTALVVTASALALDKLTRATYSKASRILATRNQK